MLLSIIIPTINRYGDLRNTIGYLIEQDCQGFEILLIDQASQDNFTDLSHLDPRIQHIHIPDFTSASKARNLGILKAKGEVLLFLDDDVIIEREDFLTQHLNCYENKNIPGVVGCTLELRVNQQVRMDRHKWSYPPETGWLFFPQNYGEDALVGAGRSCNLSVRRQVALNVRGMDERFDKGAHREEADFCMRVRNKYGLFFFNPKASLIHIGNSIGGIRSWEKRTRELKAQHHYDGAFYFLFKNIRLKHYPIHMLSILLFFFYDKSLLKNPKLLAMSFYRFILGAVNGFSMSRKSPIYISQ